MANEKRVLTNFLGGEVQENPLASGATSMTNPAFVAFPAIDATQHMPLMFDPDGIEGAPFIKYITAHTASSDTVTITAAGQEGTTERAVSQAIPFVHTFSDRDLPRRYRQGGSDTDYSTAGTVLRPIAKPLEQFGVAAYSGLNSGATFAVTFPVAFAYPPHVTGMIAKGTVTDTNIVPALASVTTTTLTILIWSRTNLNGLGGEVHWCVRGEAV